MKGTDAVETKRVEVLPEAGSAVKFESKVAHEEGERKSKSKHEVDAKEADDVDAEVDEDDAQAVVGTPAQACPA